MNHRGHMSIYLCIIGHVSSVHKVKLHIYVVCILSITRTYTYPLIDGPNKTPGHINVENLKLFSIVNLQF